MTRVIYRQGERNELEISGHATGSPVVCAAVSAIAYALAGYLANRDPCAVVELTDGRAHLSAVGADEAFLVAYIGLKQIEMSNPDFVAVKQAEKPAGRDKINQTDTGGQSCD